MLRSFISSLALSATLTGCALAQGSAPADPSPPNVPEFSPAFEGQTDAPGLDSGVTFEVEVVADGLVHPWGMAVLPDGSTLVTERAGTMRIIGADGSAGPAIEGIPPVLAESQGGLLDVALGQDFATDRTVYWTYAKPLGGGMSATAAARGTLSGDGTRMTGVEEIFVQEPPSPSPMHYGSRIVPDASGAIWITTGEHFTRKERVLAQDLGTTYGKVVRVTPDGQAVEDNPFLGQAGAIDTIWSFGHRNIQGAALHPLSGALWTIEHGPKGGDELNIPEAGANYGWPVISYGENYSGQPVGSGETARDGMEQPIYYWDPVIAPGGMLFYDGEMFADWQGDLIIASLTPGAIVRLELDGERVTGEERLLTDQGRIRDVAVDSDGAILALVDQEDGALLRLTPASR